MNSLYSKANVESSRFVPETFCCLFMQKKKKPTKVKIIKTRMFYDCETRVGAVPGGKADLTLTLMWWLIPQILDLLGLIYFQKELKPERFPGKLSG